MFDPTSTRQVETRMRRWSVGIFCALLSQSDRGPGNQTLDLLPALDPLQHLKKGNIWKLIQQLEVSDTESSGKGR